MNQEQIVDGIIVDYLESKFVGVKDKITNSSKYFKRNGMASIIGSDRRVYELIKKLESKNEECDYLTYFDELVNAYREYVEVADVEKKTLGEVMTPITLVEDMLNTLPSDVWSNPNLKWLDPCAGVGTFPSIVVQRLMKGLEDFEKNPIKRYRHIIEEMIYVCELQPKNMFIFQCVFDKDDTNELNTYCGSFLDENFDKHMTDVWGVEKFDIIIGNPPYQTSGNGGQYKTQPIWDKFTLKSLLILNEGGYLNMVHPSGWRNIDGRFVEVKNQFKNKNLIFLSINDEKKGIEVFGAETRFDYYCLENVINKGKTKIIFQDGVEQTIDISELDFIPNGKLNLIKSLIATNDDEKVSLLHSESNYAHRKPYMSKENNSEYKYPCIYTINSNSEPKLWFSSNNNKGDFGMSKLIWSTGRISSVGSFIDTDGKYGLMEYSSAIVDEPKNLSDIKKVFDSKEFKTIMELCAVGQLAINYKVIATFRKDFYKQFLNN